METKENAYMQDQTEEIAGARAGDGDMPAQASTDLGKFKDVSALLKAYDSLQSEFTRRSQRLKELTRQTQQLGNSDAQDASAQALAQGGAEKLKNRAKERKAEEERFNSFVQEIERKETQPSSLPDVAGERVSTREVGAGLSETREKASVDGEKVGAISSDELFTLVSRDESVRLKIIGEYLSSIGKSGAPLMRGGAGLCVSPSVKAKSIGEAGAMALRFFKKEQTSTF